MLPFIDKNRFGPSCVVSVSGGLDSTTLLALLLSEQIQVVPVFFRYGSKHNRFEEQAAQAVCQHYHLQLTTLDFGELFYNFRSALLANDTRPIPQSGYDKESMSQTVVPGRNTIFLGTLAALAESLDIPAIAVGTHAGDHHLYPDCRPAYNKAIQNALFEGSDKKVQAFFPFEHSSKKEILESGLKASAPYDLTRSCYEDEQTACGRCGTCVERLEAFAALGLADPVLYKQS